MCPKQRLLLISQKLQLPLGLSIIFKKTWKLFLYVHNIDKIIPVSIALITGKNRENRQCQEVAKSSKKQDNNPNLLPKTQQNIFKKPEKQKNSCSSSDSDEDLFPNLNKNCVVSETERKNYVRVHHMFSRILNFLFVILVHNCNGFFERKKNCLFDKKKLYWHFTIYFHS